MLTTADFDIMTRDDRWSGFGYLGERDRTEAGPARVAEADARALTVANSAGMDYDQLFKWANSKIGRWYGDCMFGADGRDARKYLPTV